MNDFLVDEIFKNTQRLRIKNQVQENQLHALIEGHKGYREKLNKTLSKLEKSRQQIEQEYFYMEREMRLLGLSPRNKKLTTARSIATNILPSKNIRTSDSNSTSNSKNSSSTNSTSDDSSNSSTSSSSNNDENDYGEENASDKNVKSKMIMKNKNLSFLSQLVKDSSPANTSSNELNDTINSNFYNNSNDSSIDLDENDQYLSCLSKSKHVPNTRRLSTLSLAITPGRKNSLDQMHAVNGKRKFSLDSACPNGPSKNTISFLKSLRPSNLLLIEAKKPNKTSSDNQNGADEFCFNTSMTKPDSYRLHNQAEVAQSPSLSNSSEEMDLFQQFVSATSQKRLSNQSARTINSVITTYSTRTNQSQKTNFSNLTNVTGNTLRRNASYLSNSNFNLPKIIRNSTSSSLKSAKTNLNSQNEETKRRVSFGQIELTQLDIPVLYKYSNVGYERYKMNPHFYLPDGSLKRKFSLPKLENTLESVKNCQYLRRNTMPNEKIDVKNIFKHLEPSPNELKDFDILPAPSTRNE